MPDVCLTAATVARATEEIGRPDAKLANVSKRINSKRYSKLVAFLISSFRRF
jgi:hypothetical protein